MRDLQQECADLMSRAHDLRGATKSSGIGELADQVHALAEIVGALVDVQSGIRFFGTDCVYVPRTFGAIEATDPEPDQQRLEIGGPR